MRALLIKFHSWLGKKLYPSTGGPVKTVYHIVSYGSGGGGGGDMEQAKIITGSGGIYYIPTADEIKAMEQWKTL